MWALIYWSISLLYPFYWEFLTQTSVEFCQVYTVIRTHAQDMTWFDPRSKVFLFWKTDLDTHSVWFTMLFFFFPRFLWDQGSLCQLETLPSDSLNEFIEQSVCVDSGWKCHMKENCILLFWAAEIFLVDYYYITRHSLASSRLGKDTSLSSSGIMLICCALTMAR